MILSRVLSLALTITCGLSQPQRPGPRQPNIDLIYQFPGPPAKSYIENLAIRKNGQLLLTNLNPPLLYLLDPREDKAEPKLLHNFTGDGTTLTGITEAGHDTFYVAVQNETLGTFKAIPGSARLFRVCLNGDEADVSLFAPVPAASFINDLITLRDRRTILAADSDNGTVVSIDSSTGRSAIALKDPLMQPEGRFPLGINGMKITDDHLYFTNSARDIFARMPLQPGQSPGQPIKAAGPAVQLAAAPTGAIYDDFALDARGAFIATQGGNRIVRLQAPPNTGKPDNLDTPWIQTDFAGSNTTTTIDEPTSALFGRGSDFNSLYVVTGGGSGLQAPLAGAPKPPPVVGAQIIRVRLPSECFLWWLCDW